MIDEQVYRMYIKILKEEWIPISSVRLPSGAVYVRLKYGGRAHRNDPIVIKLTPGR